MVDRPVRTTKHLSVRQPVAGFTLIEIMVAAMLLLIMAAAFVPLFLTGLSQANMTRNKSIATNIAREKMEQVRQLDYREIQEDAADPTDSRNLSMRFGTSETVRGIPFTIDYSVPATAVGDLKTVTITVTWTGPPTPSPAVITTSIHQQYVGPRGSHLVFTPTFSDPLGTPFKQLGWNPTVARYFVAEADWALVYNNFGQPGESPKNVYMRLFFVDSADAVIPVGPSAADYKIGSSYLHHGTNPLTGEEAVWFEYSFDTGPGGELPDGYWDAKAVIYNEYNEPGNVWRLRVRIENGGPGQPTVSAAGQPDDQLFVVTWIPGPERDRSRFSLAWSRLDDGAWTPWVTLSDDLPGTQYTYVHVGSVASEIDPWGTSDIPHTYKYQVVAYDIVGNASPPGEGEGQLPPPPTTTTTGSSSTSSTLSTTTTAPGSTTSTTVLSTVIVKNLTNKQWVVVVKDSSGVQVASTTIKNGNTWTTPALQPASYSITTTRNTLVRTGSFTLPNDAGLIVMEISG